MNCAPEVISLKIHLSEKRRKPCEPSSQPLDHSARRLSNFLRNLPAEHKRPRHHFSMEKASSFSSESDVTDLASLQQDCIHRAATHQESITSTDEGKATAIDSVKEAPLQDLCFPGSSSDTDCVDNEDTIEGELGITNVDAAHDDWLDTPPMKDVGLWWHLTMGKGSLNKFVANV
jgi:hypothetical protein